MKRMIGTLFGIVLVLSLIGCAAESKVVNNSATDSYPFYEQWLKEQAEMKAQQCEVWVYGSSITFPTKLYNALYAETIADEINFVVYDETDMGVDQFKTKLQAAIMVGDGPDMVIADNIELLSNIDKSIEAGAFLSFDEYITDWNSDTYYMRAVEGARSADGKSYLIPPFL